MNKDQFMKEIKKRAVPIDYPRIESPQQLTQQITTEDPCPLYGFCPKTADCSGKFRIECNNYIAFVSNFLLDKPKFPLPEYQK